MDRTGPIIIVDDDIDECELVTFAYSELGVKNELLCFLNAKDVVVYLEQKRQTPFLILSDVNMPGMGGLQLLEHIIATPALKTKDIPFIFLSTSASPKEIDAAYKLYAKGVFHKGGSVEQIKNVLSTIISYWRDCKYPKED